jgi:molybdopterin-guanine dinucleotide biosynthesis protein B
VKHHHSDFPVAVDSSGTDTWRHRRAGATSVALVSPKDVALFRYTEETLSLDDVISRFLETDIVLVEGFHLEPQAKIEVLSDQSDERLCQADENVLALVGVTGHHEAALSFSPDIKPLVDLIERKVLGCPAT